MIANNVGELYITLKANNLWGLKMEDILSKETNMLKENMVRT